MISHILSYLCMAVACGTWRNFHGMMHLTGYIAQKEDLRTRGGFSATAVYVLYTTTNRIIWRDKINIVSPTTLQIETISLLKTTTLATSYSLLRLFPPFVVVLYSGLATNSKLNYDTINLE